MGKDDTPRRRLPTVNIYEAKTHFSDLIDQVAKGEEIVISRRGKPVARLAPIPGRGIKFGILKGKLTVPADFDAPLPAEVQRFFEGGAEDE
jgi:prevent-host-death family protein